jgi:hypothetical protein
LKAGFLLNSNIENYSITTNYTEYEMKNIKYILFVAIFVLGGCAASTQRPPQGGALPPQVKGDLRLLIPWGNGQTVIQTVIEEIDSAGYKLRNLAFYKDSLKENDRLFSLNSRDYPVGIIPLKDNSGNLLIIWMSGVAYHFSVYAFRDGNVESVLEVNSDIYPELFYEKKGSEDLSILVTNMDLVKNKKTKEKNVQPVSATLYRWKDGQYVSVPNIPWAKRFSSGK